MKNTFIIIGLLLLILLFFKNNIIKNDLYVIKEFPNFLSEDECNTIMRISTGKLSNSKVFMKDRDGLDTTIRDSKQCWLKDTDDALIKKLSDRIAKETKTEISLQEHLQVVKYDSNGFYKPHYDACNSSKYDCERMNKDKGPRYMTFIIYLNDGFEGGETYFPRINKKIVPKMGKAVLFYNVDKDGVILNKSLHGGLNVLNGEKWIANKWIHLG